MERFESVLVSGFALLALVSAIDLYAALSYLVSEKTSELGLRLALGTSGSRISA
jgi:ABC-type antimicrobial peptide transport system permease subunit